MVVARRRLLQAIEHQIREKEKSTNFTQEFRDPFSLLLVICAIFRFTDYARKANEDTLAPFFEGTFLVAAATLNILLNLTQKRRHHEEMAERVRVAVQNMVDTARSEGDETSPRRTWIGGAKPTLLLPSTSYVACYRDNQWQRIPMNLLVEGDVVGLMSGDVAPGQVRLVVDPSGSSHSHDEQQHVYPRGSKIPTWSSQFAGTARCNATFNPALLLELCGEMRIFEMMETPVVSDIEDALFRINRPETYTQKLQAKARLIAIYVCTLYSVLVLVAIGLRVVLQHRSLYTTLNHILLGPIGIWLCFASLNTPFVLFIAEAAATASILGSFENIVLPKKTRHVPKTANPNGGDDDGLVSNSMHTTSGNNDSAEANTEVEDNPTHESDIYDFEDREKVRSEKASKQSAIRRSLEYFLVALRFRIMRCTDAHASNSSTSSFGDDGHGLRLPVPFRSFRLLERLGSTTMLCCFDDDILCEQSPSVEEIFLLNDKQGSSTVLDLHPERECETGLKFEDPKWKQHLPSLKPIGLAIMLNDTEDPASHYHTSMKYLVNETLSNLDDASTGGVRDPYMRSCMQRLSAHVRMLPFPKHLLNLSREMGFVVDDDLNVFQRRQSIHIICPRLAHHEHTTDHHDQGQDDMRYRGNLKTHLYSTVVQDKRTNRHQLLSRGHPTIALTQCSEYWDGKSICPLTSEKRRAILEMYNQWRVEDLDCVALSYVPVPHKLNALFSRKNHSPDASMNASRFGSNKTDMLPPVYLVDDSNSGDVNASLDGAIPANGGFTYGGDKFRNQLNVSPVASQCSADDKRFSASDMDATSNQYTSGSSVPIRSLSPTSRQRNPTGLVSFSDVASSTAINPSETGSTERDSLLWRIQEDQIFLGMVATGVQPKKGIPEFIEDLTACGIRFVYFSPRNMRRSKLLAEKMGIETDWNCAISLRPLDSDGPDPHRMTSNYSDWDVKARLPHGVEAIKRHLAEVDNVPLLVSLYTDSTPETISEMISIFQENNEVVMGVGSSLKESNAPLFSKADSAAALQGGLQSFFDEQLPKGKELPVFSEEDIQFSHILNTLTCSFRINSKEDDVHAKDATPSLTHLIELIRLGRCVLTNFHQMIAFIFVSQLFIATLILISYIVPFPLVPQLSCASIFWLLWILVPTLSLSMLASASEKDVMKQTPRKNEEIELQEDLPRLATYFLIRHVPSALLAIVVFECLLGFSLASSRAQLGDEYRDFQWFDFMLHNSIVLARPRPPVVAAAVDRAEAGMLLLIGASILASSCGYLYRCESIFSMSPLRNRMWLGASTGLLVVQLTISMVRAGLAGSDGHSLWFFIGEAVPWYFWTVFFVWPMIVIAVDEAVKSHDRHHMTRYFKFLRMQFDTRLGMWSPK
uniref:Cation-transporting P-type ATPase C-terminal domain-containing protein n=1 Tax=Globisporangium ultimum (strain ATCC 200006 / CBS 805.95 / DAOM BR144) TaxID=431595 RepID=K3WDV0_GLOUD